ASRSPHMNWIVRQHPYEPLVGQSKHFREIVGRHSRPENTVRVVEVSISTASLFGCVDAVTTVNGTAGIEFSATGIPCILAGNPYYGDLGFAVRPKTRKEYFAALLSIPTMKRLGDEQRQLAKEAALVELVFSRISSS